MSARERKLDFLVWWRCLRSSVYMTFSFRSAFNWPVSIWLSVISSGRGTDWRSRHFFFVRKMCWRSWSTPLTNNLWQRGRLQVQHDGALLDARFELHQAVQGQRGHMRLTPALAALLHLLLKLDPSGQGRTKGTEIGIMCWDLFTALDKNLFHLFALKQVPESKRSLQHINNSGFISLWTNKGYKLKWRQERFSFLYKTTPHCFALVTVHRERAGDAGQRENKK